MNNCPKCGNPLQPGTVSCPICGTNIQQVQAPAPAANQNINVSTSNSTPQPKEQTIEPTQGVQAAIPVIEETKTAPQEVTAPATPSNQPVQTETVAQVQPTPSSQNLNVAPTIEAQSVTPTINTPAASPIQTSEPTSTGISAPQEIVAPEPEAKPDITPELQRVQPSETAIPSSVGIVPTSVSSPTTTIQEATPAISKNEQSTLSPSIPASLTNTNNSLQDSTIKVEAPKEEKKVKGKFGKKNITIIAVAVIVVVIGAVLYLNMGKSNTMKPNPTTPIENNTIASSSAGYKFSLPSEWSIVEDGTNVILKNNDETIIIKLENIQNSFENLNEEKINKYFETLGSINVNTISTQISGKDAYLINATINNSPVQIYYINSGSRLITGATIIYQNEDIKSSSDAIITELIGTLSFADESVNAIGTLNMYSNIFNIYKGILNYKETIIPDNISENNQENNNEDIIDQPVQGENQPSEDNGTETIPNDNQNNNSEN